MLTSKTPQLDGVMTATNARFAPPMPTATGALPAEPRASSAAVVRSPLSPAAMPSSTASYYFPVILHESDESSHSVMSTSNSSPQLILKDSTHQDDAIQLTLAEKLIGDILVGTSVTLCIVPFLTVIDKALVQRSAATAAAASSMASGTGNVMLQSMYSSITDMIRRPVAYMKSPAFLWMWATYASTYSVANMLKTATSEPPFATSTSTKTVTAPSTAAATASKAHASMTLFVGTGLTNTTASLIKDRAYAHMFGSSIAHSIPITSYAAWMARDFTVIGSSFILPEMFAQSMTNTRPDLWSSSEDALPLAQFVSPVLAQCMAGPLHFIGLDCYNRPRDTILLQLQQQQQQQHPHSVSLSSYGTMTAVIESRIHALRQALAEVVTARMVRIIPGYAIAGVWNRSLKRQYQELLLQFKQQQHQYGHKRRPWSLLPRPSHVGFPSTASSSKSTF